MSEKWTEGPWEVTITYQPDWGETKADVHPVGQGDDYRVCEVHDEGGAGTTVEANAHLIAAAPDLYEALSNLLGVVYGDGGTTPDAKGMAERAIARARGE